MAHAIPRAWPAITAVGAVVVIAMATLVVDLTIERNVGARTNQLVDNVMYSIAIVNDLRYQARKLTDAQSPHPR